MKKEINFNWNKTIKEMCGINDEEKPYALQSVLEEAEKAFNDEINTNSDSEVK